MRIIYERTKTKILNRIASKHIVGSDLNDAVKVCKSMNQSGFSVTLGFWSNQSEPPENVLNVLLKTLNAISDNGLNAQLAIKLHSLGNNKLLIEELAGAAKEKNIRLHFDSHGYETIEKTLEVVYCISQKYGKIGCTLPSRFERSLDDAKQLRDLGINIRVVKGHWIDPANKVDCRDKFFEIVKSLSGHNTQVSIATHDAPLAKSAIKHLKSTGTSCEVEQMFSLPSLTNKKPFRKDVPIRIYIPFGFPYLPYNVRFALERPAIIYWMLKDLVTSKKKSNDFRNDNKCASRLRLIPNKTAS